MTTEEDFQAALDASPDDWQTRLVFADWLEERGDPRADGYRALGRYHLHPANEVRVMGDEPFKNSWAVLFDEYLTCAPPDHCKLPRRWFQLTKTLGVVSRRLGGDLLSYSIFRRDAENASAVAYAGLSAAGRDAVDGDMWITTSFPKAKLDV